MKARSAAMSTARAGMEPSGPVEEARLAKTRERDGGAGESELGRERGGTRLNASAAAEAATAGVAAAAAAAEEAAAGAGAGTTAAAEARLAATLAARAAEAAAVRWRRCSRVPF